VEALLRHTWRTRLGGQPLALSGEALAWHQRSERRRPAPAACG
jgi:hypothetical protein